MFLYAGTHQGLGVVPYWQSTGGVPYTRLGMGVSSAGDIDADGLLDIVLATRDEIRVFHGGSGGLPTSPDVTFPVNPNYWDTDVTHVDVNGDGFDNVLSLSSGGKIHLGSAQGLAPSVAGFYDGSHAWVDPAPPSSSSDPTTRTRGSRDTEPPRPDHSA